MGLDEFMITPAALSPAASRSDGPIALIDLCDVAGDHPLVLPPHPVIGLGKPDHPLGEQLDAMVASREQAATIVAQVLRNPRTAAVTVELLRLLPKLSMADGLVAESFAYALLQGSAEHIAWRAASARALVDAGEEALTMNRDGDALTLTLSRPRYGNAVNTRMRDGLYEAFCLATLDTSIAKIVLKASGKAFSLGAELAEFGTTTDPATAHIIRRQTLPASIIAQCCDRLEVHVQGACVGAGLEMAAFARKLTATRNAWFQLPELVMGLLPGAGGSVSLTRRIGRQRAALMILSGRRIPAPTALEWGLIDAIVDNPPADDSGAQAIG